MHDRYLAYRLVVTIVDSTQLIADSVLIIMAHMAVARHWI